MTDKQNKKGTLYGLGVGPGDPGLLTLRAVEVLGAVDVVFAASSTKNDYSLALSIAEAHLRPDARQAVLKFPMTKDQNELEAAWEDNARQVLAELDTGKNAAFLTLGDPLTYSTYGYLLKTVFRLDKHVKLETVPGITAYHAAAAKLNLPLVEGDEAFILASGVSDPMEIERLATCADNLAVLKTYRNYDRIVEALQSRPERFITYTVSRCGLPGERMVGGAENLAGQDMPYLSLIIAKRKKD